MESSSNTPVAVLDYHTSENDPENAPVTLNPLRLAPGLVLLAAIGYAGKWIEAWFKSYGKAHHKSLPNIEYVREAGSEGIELVMWLIARGAMGDVAGGRKPKVAHRFYHVPASNTAVGHLVLEEA